MGMTINELEQFKQSILDAVRVMMQTTGQVTQYVGARYVPLFADPIDWSDQMEYEPLTIVMHQGNSFTSRQFVPTGIGIDNTEFWASTGNYNAQIEQYRQEVAALKSSIDDKAPLNHASTQTTYGVGNNVEYGHLKIDENGADGIAASTVSVDNAINGNPIKVFNLVGENSQAQSCQIIKTDIWGMIDCGDIMATAIDTFMQANSITSLDYLVISHFHGDHVNAIDTVSKYISSETKVFVQMPVGSNNDEIEKYNLGLGKANAAVTGKTTLIVPNDGETIVIGKTKLTFLNTNTANQSYYDTQTWANNKPSNLDFNEYASNHSSLNNYSLITFIDYGGSSIANVGDVEGAAQVLYMDKIKTVDVCNLPHHGENINDNFQFYEKLSPKMWIKTYNPTSSYDNEGNTVYTIGSYPNRYFYNNTTPVYGAIKTRLDVTIQKHEVAANGGVPCIVNQYSTGGMHWTTAISPLYFNLNPYKLIMNKLDELYPWLSTSSINKLYINLTGGFGANTCIGHEIFNTLWAIRGISSIPNITYAMISPHKNGLYCQYAYAGGRYMPGYMHINHSMYPSLAYTNDPTTAYPADYFKHYFEEITDVNNFIVLENGKGLVFSGDNDTYWKQNAKTNLSVECITVIEFNYNGPNTISINKLGFTGKYGCGVSIKQGKLMMVEITATGFKFYEGDVTNLSSIVDVTSSVTITKISTTV